MTTLSPEEAVDLPMTHLRRDPIRGHWTVIAPDRSRRPDEFVVRVSESDNGEPCPFCPGNEAMTPPEIASVRPDASAPNTPGWQVRVVPNRYPALSLADAPDTSLVHDAGELFRAHPALGVQEIVVATPEHHRHGADLGADHWDTVLAACQDRMDQLARDPRIKQVVLFVNHGARAGASRHHAHLQIMALPLPSSAAGRELLNARSYRQRHDRCLFCEVLSRELADGRRVVRADDVAVTHAPWASRVPFELSLTPRAHHASFLKVPPAERRRVAAHLRQILRGLRRLFGDLPYNWVLHTVPTQETDPQVYHWHLDVLPRLGQQGGYEWGTGGFINPVAPEEAAAALREVWES